MTDQGHLIIDREDVERWERQIATPYSDLSEKEKASDMEQVDRYWQLITADRKRVALEARIDELENRLRVQFIPSHWARLCAEVNSWAKYVDRRIAELKAQQEEI